MDFNLQQYLTDTRREQKEDHDALATTVTDGFARIERLVAAHDTRLVVQENFRRNVRWITGVIITCFVLPLLVYFITEAKF